MLFRSSLMFDLSGRTAAVTGAGSGIGEAIAHLFARRGAEVAVLDIAERRGARGRRADPRGRGKAEAWALRRRRAARVGAVFAEIEAKLGRLDILVNNAGIAHVGTIEQTTEEDFDRVFRVNVKGIYLCAQAAVALMLRHGGGVILNMASIASLIGVPDRFAYSMSKGAVHTMTMSIAIDYMKRNIRCNCICPARVHTPFVDSYRGAPTIPAASRRCSRSSRPISRSAAWARRRKWPRWRIICAPTKPRSSPGRPIRSTAACW